MASGTLSLGMRKALIPGALAIGVASSLVTTLQAAERHGVALPPSTASHLAQGPQQGLSPEIEAKARQALSALEEGDTLKALQIQQEVMGWVRSKLTKSHPFYAESLAQLGRLLSWVGRESDALVATRESVVIYRELAKLDRRYVHALAKALSEMSMQLYANDRIVDAQQIGLEAVSLLRDGARDPSKGLDLAIAIRRLATIMLPLGKYDESLAMLNEAVKISVSSGQAGQESKRELAKSLMVQAGIHNLFDQYEDSLEKLLRVQQIYRDLGLAKPALQDEVAAMHNGLGQTYIFAGQARLGFSHQQQAMALLRQMERENLALQAQLASLLADLGVSYLDTDDRKKSLELVQESTQIYRRLMAIDPIYTYSLAESLLQLGFAKTELGQLDQGWRDLKEAEALIRRLGVSHFYFNSGIARTLLVQGTALVKMDRLKEAIGLTEEAIRSYKRLAMTDPYYRALLASSLYMLAEYYVGASNFALAINAFQESEQLLRPLVAVRPRYQIRLAMLLKDRAVVYSKLNQYDSSLASAEEALLIFRKLANGDTSYDLQAAQALLSIGTARIRLANYQEAILPLQEALEGMRIFAKKANVSPSPYDLDIAEALLHLGIAYGETGRDSSAATVETAAVSFLRPLARAHPIYGDALVRALQNLSITFHKLDQLDRAIVALEESQQILRQLVNVDPDYKKSLDQTIERLEFLKMQKKSPPRQPATTKI